MRGTRRYGTMLKRSYSSRSKSIAIALIAIAAWNVGSWVVLEIQRPDSEALADSASYCYVDEVLDELESGADPARRGSSGAIPLRATAGRLEASDSREEACGAVAWLMIGAGAPAEDDFLWIALARDQPVVYQALVAAGADPCGVELELRRENTSGLSLYSTVLDDLASC